MLPLADLLELLLLLKQLMLLLLLNLLLFLPLRQLLLLLQNIQLLLGVFPVDLGAVAAWVFGAAGDYYEEDAVDSHFEAVEVQELGDAGDELAVEVYVVVAAGGLGLGVAFWGQ